MAKALFNSSGVPLIGYGTKGMYLSTNGAPPDKLKQLSQPSIADPDKTSVNNIELSDWGSGNKFPKTADELINSEIGRAHV